MTSVGARLLVYASRETHTWIQKAADLFGLGTDAIRWIPAGQDQRLDPATLRHRIDHNSIVTPELRERYSEIGIVPVVFGSFYTCAGIAWTDFWKTGVGENWRALLDANPGLTIAWHGDDPSLPPVLGNRQLVALLELVGVGLKQLGVLPDLKSQKNEGADYTDGSNGFP